MEQTNTNNLRDSVIRTLAYYKALKTPLTLVQVGRYLVNSPLSQSSDIAEIRDSNSPDNRICLLSEVKKMLDSLAVEGIVARQKGLYWLGTNGRESNIQNNIWFQFIQREKRAQKKIGKVRKVLWLFSLIPFLRNLFICGSVARKVCRSSSDIDFLVLTKQNRIWTVRFLLTLCAFLLGKKTSDARLMLVPFLPKFSVKKEIHQQSRRDKFCLNHYRASSALKLGEQLQDLYSAQEYARMINLYSCNRVDRKFFKKNKIWMKVFLSNFNFKKLHLYRYAESDRKVIIRKKLEKVLSGKIGDTIEQLLFYLQAKKIQFGNQHTAGSSTPSDRRIITNNNVIIFHLNPRAPIVMERYKKLVSNLELSV